MSRRVSTPVLPLFLVVLGAAAAFADGENGRGDEDRIARLTRAQDRMSVLLKKGERLEAAGDLESALACYTAALEAYDQAMRDEGRDPRSLLAVAARQRGASRATDAAVEAALKWLAAHQDDNGRWDPQGFQKHDPADDKCDGPGKQAYDVGVTALSLLAFLEAGYTDRGARSQNPYSQTVRLGLRYLIEAQDNDGCFGTRASQHFLYNHAIATAAMAEAYAVTRNPRYQRPAIAGVEFLHKARNPYMGWRYGIRDGDNDTSMTGWCVYALARARDGGLPVDKAEMQASMDGAMVWVEKMTDPDTGRAGYNAMGGLPARPGAMQDKFPPAQSEAMTATAVAMRIHAGQSAEDDAVRKGIALMLQRPPQWNPAAGAIDLYYWFWGTRACVAAGGAEWKAWNTALKEAVLNQQHREGSGARTGSWDPMGPWGPDGGRVYSTAILALTLQSYYLRGRWIAPR